MGGWVKISILTRFIFLTYSLTHQFNGQQCDFDHVIFLETICFEVSPLDSLRGMLHKNILATQSYVHTAPLTISTQNSDHLYNKFSDHQKRLLHQLNSSLGSDLPPSVRLAD